MRYAVDSLYVKRSVLNICGISREHLPYTKQVILKHEDSLSDYNKNVLSEKITFEWDEIFLEKLLNRVLKTVNKKHGDSQQKTDITEANFKCADCGKTFHLQQSLKSHKLFHTGKSRFK